MSRKESDIRFTLADSPDATIQLTSVSVGGILGDWEREAVAVGTNRDILTWQMIILRYFMEDFLPNHGMVIMKSELIK